ncbi:hypothetical protein [Desulforhopalus singaporensis]|uniref:Uncharacterized protein n=1 Tax=Desulforhopalus singaporensis TaxID=91360 RepID=A0A1H0M8B0_9BACT|nr:hypothetical protein [Desulforhopalus singaporensis]SDO76597.1 hypothetical protein SAMN05660330_01020 [Desulforhopalus singaporensis]
MVARRSNSRRGKKVKQQSWIKVNLSRILAGLALFALLVVTVGTVGYVIFFRTVFA